MMQLIDKFFYNNFCNAKNPKQECFYVKTVKVRHGR